MRFTVLTPTYNRAYILEQLYESLRRQSFTDFEWVVVDDGSTDGTEELIKGFQQKDNFFPIVYLKTPNGGKHRAWNRGVNLASGELVFGCDSDDYLTDDALELADRVEKSLTEEQRKSFAGICGLRGNTEMMALGSSFEDSYMDMTYLDRVRNNVLGDKTEIFYSDVWQRYKYAEFDGENFLTEATSLTKMGADGLKIRFFNSIVKVTEYRADGLTANSYKKFISNPKGWGLYLGQQIRFGQITGMKKCYKLWEYYDCCIKTVGVDEIAGNLGMSRTALKALVLVERINRKLNR